MTNEAKIDVKYLNYFTKYQLQVIQQFAKLNKQNYIHLLIFLYQNDKFILPNSAFEYFETEKINKNLTQEQIIKLWNNLRIDEKFKYDIFQISYKQNFLRELNDIRKN